MASKTEVTPQKEEVPEKEGLETPPDSPLLDLSDAAIKKLIRSAKKLARTHDGRRCDRGKRAGQRLGVHRATARRCGHLSRIG